MILDKLTEDLNGIDELLLTAQSDQLSDKQRDRILDKKTLYQWFTGFFKDTETEMKSLDKTIDEEEEHLKNNQNNFI